MRTRLLTKATSAMLKQPIFIVGHPRSGTSLVRSLIERSEHVWSIGREGKPIWERDSLHPEAGAAGTPTPWTPPTRPPRWRPS